MAAAESEGLEKKFKIHTTISTSNMVCFDPEGRIKKYENVEMILNEFYNLRLKYYQMRKVIDVAYHDALILVGVHARSIDDGMDKTR